MSIMHDKNNLLKPAKIKAIKHPNYTVTAVLATIAVFAILGALYMTMMIALKSPSDMTNVLAWPKQFQFGCGLCYHALSQTKPFFQSTLLLLHFGNVYSFQRHYAALGA
ncbi:hypothetical protein AWRIB553_1782 [Oenococcus oeni AWRIB553]|nr:hypothetical protein [Oenococcus oeni]EJO04057.1 hypothetical protein AWRIB553_1782 [Oenococcus oeni AWRIB553]